MDLLNFEEQKKLYTPPRGGRSRLYVRQTELSQEDRDTELNNIDREKVRKDFSGERV